MKNRYRLFRRGKGRIFWSQDNQTGKQESLQTKDRALAERLLHAKNEAHIQPTINIQIARTYLLVGNPLMAKRTWNDVINEIIKHKTGETRRRWATAAKDKALIPLNGITLLETTADHFLRALEGGTVSTNVYLRRLHNFALDMNWLPAPVIPRRQWPVPRYQEKRAITLLEHRQIVSHEELPERRAFYELAWYLGASQSDIAALDAENIDWDNRVISYSRKKTGQIAQVKFGDEVESVLCTLPKQGPLFPSYQGYRACDRSTEFKKRCQKLGIKGITLHSYRYAWAERARTLGYPERFVAAVDFMAQSE